MTGKIEQKYILCCAVFFIFQTTSAKDDSIPPTEIIEETQGSDCYGYKTKYPSITGCNPKSIYYSYDGSCNNLANPIKGKAFTPFKRYLQADYSDLLEKPYTDRPDPRHLSLSLFKENTNTSLEKDVNVWFLIYGQFLIHDFALATSNPANITCCPVISNDNECMPIIIQAGDELQLLNHSCLNFVRSLGVGPIDGNPDLREQLNALTSYLDASMVYGSSKKELDSLRDNKTGKMIVTNVGHDPLLPTQHNILPKNDCPLFRAGDNRVNENVILAVHHVIWVREHNFLVDKLAEIHPEWDAEQLFQNARRILIAEMQHITYNEFLPILVGDTIMGLYYLFDDYYSGYDEEVDPAISNAFTTAAFRYGHAMINDFITFIEHSHDDSKRNNTNICHKNAKLYSCKEHDVSMNTLLKSMDELYSCETSVDAFIQGCIKKNAQKSNDMKATKAVTLNTREPHDLIGFNIQRGRDHGIPTYNEWRELFELNSIDFYYAIDHEEPVFQKLKELYKDPQKIDLFVGGILENKMEGAITGPTFAHMIGKQFNEIKYGDRLWYENTFVEGQLEEIKSQTMSKVIMRNTGISSLPYKAFLIPSETNPELPRAFSNFNFTAWF